MKHASGLFVGRKVFFRLHGHRDTAIVRGPPVNYRVPVEWTSGALTMCPVASLRDGMGRRFMLTPCGRSQA
jgi:hypothetical protein